MPRKLKCKCNLKSCKTCYNREYRRKNYSSFKDKFNENRRNNYNKLRSGPLIGTKVISRPVHVGISTDLLLDKLNDSEIIEISKIFGNFGSSSVP